jgi:hypothetical protein
VRGYTSAPTSSSKNRFYVQRGFGQTQRLNFKKLRIELAAEPPGRPPPRSSETGRGGSFIDERGLNEAGH